jgi:hypothetical protein
MRGVDRLSGVIAIPRGPLAATQQSKAAAFGRDAVGYYSSGCRDLNPGPLDPQSPKGGNSR